MSMHESFPQPSASPEKSPEKKVSDLGAGDTVIRDGESCTITSYRSNAAGEIEMAFSDGESAILESDDTLEVPA